MFGSKSGLLPPPEVIARFDEMFERHYPSKTPESSALVDRVRCRDLTCRWPGCDRPAHDCDLDHTISYANGGPTPRRI